MNTSTQVETLARDRTPASAERAYRLWALLFVLAITAVMAGRLFRLVDRYAANIFYSDQWAFYNATLFEHHSLWQMFDWQHGPHRQGVGAIVSWLIEPMFHWSSRAEAFLAWAIFVQAALLALYLKKRLYGPLTYSDALIPLIFLTPLEYESLFGSTNLSHGPLPILLLIVYCIGWTHPRAAWRYTWVLIANFLLIYTGFGFFVGIITPFLLILEYAGAKRAGLPNLKLSVLFTALFISVASLLSFFIGYRFDPAALCFRPLSEPLLRYLHFMDLMFADLTGLKGSGTLPTLLGGVILMVACVAFLAAIVAAVAKDRQRGTQGLVNVALLALSLLFSANTALGRACLGLLTAQSSRYVPYLIPAVLGIYFCCLAERRRPVRFLGILCSLLLAASASLPVHIGDRSMMGQYYRVKNNWRECYLQRHDIEQCDALTGNKIYPWANQQLQEKLDYLEKNKLNLYATRN